MKLIELTNKYKNRISGIVVIIIALIVTSKVYNVQVLDMQSQKARNDAQIKKNQVLESISKLEKRINAYKNLLAKKDATVILNTMSNLAKESGVKIASFQPRKEEQHPAYVKSTFNLILYAPDYHILGKFISKIENFQDVYLVESIDITSQGKELTVSFQLSSILLK